MKEHTCTTSGYDTRAQVLRAVAVVRRNWRKVAKASGYDSKRNRRGLNAIATGPKQWSAPSDLARWEIGKCGDYASLREAVHEAMPNAKRTLEVIDGAIECMSCAYWNGEAECETPRDPMNGD